MTTPTIVITVEGGDVQDVSVSHQARVVIIDFDTEGTDQSDLTMIGGESAFVFDKLQCPVDDRDARIAQVLADIEKDERP